MSLEAARNLDIQDLLGVLGEKLDMECTRLREIRLPPTSLVPEVSPSYQSVHPNGYGRGVL